MQLGNAGAHAHAVVAVGLAVAAADRLVDARAEARLGGAGAGQEARALPGRVLSKLALAAQHVADEAAAGLADLGRGAGRRQHKGERKDQQGRNAMHARCHGHLPRVMV